MELLQSNQPCLELLRKHYPLSRFLCPATFASSRNNLQSGLACRQDFLDINTTTVWRRFVVYLHSRAMDWHNPYSPILKPRLRQPVVCSLNMQDISHNIFVYMVSVSTYLKPQPNSSMPDGLASYFSCNITDLGLFSLGITLSVSFELSPISPKLSSGGTIRVPALL
jgi:hypothetical protein